MEAFPREKIFNRKLRIKDALKEDAGRGIVRIDPDAISDLKLKAGDVVEINHPITKKKRQRYYLQGKLKIRGLML